MVTKKIKTKETDWNLAGIGPGSIVVSRTRGAGNGRPNFDRMHKILLIESSSSSDDSSFVPETEVVSDEEESLNHESEEEEDDGKKPPASRVILEVKAIEEVISKSCRCPKCDGPVKPVFNTICLTTSVSLVCSNKEHCDFLFYGPSPSATVFKDKDNRERMSDYTLNVLYVLGFLSCGDGGTEAGRVLGLLGLPNNTTMERRSFGIIEDKIAPLIKELNKDILLANLVDEVRATTAGNPNQLFLWQQSLEGNIVLEKSNYPKIRCSFDMAWQQRNSGNQYASQSGHALLVGGYTRKPIAFTIKSKLCSSCKAWTKKHGDDLPPLPHTCYKNHEGSSGSMEPLACLLMTEELFRDYNCVVDMICADDDSSTRALLKWSNADNMKNNNTTTPPPVPITKGKNKGMPHVRPDKGKLSAEIPEPTFVADPNHRKKVLTGELIALDTAKVAEKATMTRMDSTRLGKNFGYMIRCLPKLPEEQYCTAAAAVLEHHFDNHAHCGEWCRWKTLSALQRQQSVRYYRCKTKDSKLYKILLDKIGRFTTLDRLKEIAHGMDTQVNESFSNTASWFAPKNKVYCGTASLSNRLLVAIGVTSLGLLEYNKRLFRKLGIIMTKNVLYHLMMKDRTRNSRLERLKTKEQKLRLTKRHDAMKKEEATARKESQKREGTYKSGMNMQGIDGYNGYTQEEIDEANATTNKRRRTNYATATCRSCGGTGHSTKASRKCLNYVPKGAAACLPVNPAALGTDGEDLLPVDAAADIDIYDGYPLVHDPDHLDTEEEVAALHTFLADAAEPEDTEVSIVRAML
jgi:hypothetical protein